MSANLQWVVKTAAVERSKASPITEVMLRTVARGEITVVIYSLGSCLDLVQYAVMALCASTPLWAPFIQE